MVSTDSTADEAVLQAIPIVVAAEPQAEAAAPLPWYARAHVPRIVDYLIVAVFMFFWL